MQCVTFRGQVFAAAAGADTTSKQNKSKQCKNISKNTCFAPAHPTALLQALTLLYLGCIYRFIL